MSPRLPQALLSALPDERLAALAAHGHDVAFATLVQRYRRELVATATRMAGPARAEDTVQQALLQAWLALERGAQVRQPRGWLHQIVRNAALQPVPGVLAERPLDDGEGYPALTSTEDLAEVREEVRRVLRAVVQLPERQRDALVATAFAGRGAAEVARHMASNGNAVRQTLHRARATLRASVTAVIPWPVLLRIARAADELPSGAAGAAAGAGGASAGFATAKVVAAVAGASLAVGGGAVLEHRQTHGEQEAARAATTATSPAPAPAREPQHATVTATTARRVVPVALTPARDEHRRDSGSSSKRRGTGSTGAVEDRRGSDGERDDDDTAVVVAPRRTHHEDDRAPAPRGDGGEDREGHSGSGSGSTAPATPTITTTVATASDDDVPREDGASGSGGSGGEDRSGSSTSGPSEPASAGDD